MDSPTSRRRFLTAAAAGATAGILGWSAWSAADSGGADGSTEGTDGGNGPTETAAGTDEATGSIDGVPDAVGLQTVVGGLDAPLDVAFAPDADRRYVAERDGRVLVHGAEGLLDEPFLDLRDAVETGGERGLLGFVLHPDFAENRRAFVRYSAPRRSGTPADYSHTFVLAAFEATADGRRARRDSERAILEIPQPRERHNAGDLAFGPDGHLYVPVGDSARNENGQDVTENLLGSVLRIDVDEQSSSASQTESGDGSTATERNYAVPDDNPLVGREGLDEHYAWGFRNPWRLSFDGEDLYVADVGQNSYEEVNLVEKGGNYGWNVKEGTHCYGADDCPDEAPDRDGEPLVDPIVEYPHSGADVSGISVTGGYVYRGSAVPALDGVYVFGDFLAEGRLFAAAPPREGDGPWPTAVVEVAGGGERLGRLLSFGRDGDGEVYALATGSDGGGLFRVVPAA